MHVETFTGRMKIVDYHLRDECFEDALSNARQLRRDLMSEMVVETDQVCWPLYYELRTLHALERWPDFIALMHRYYTLLLAMGPTDNAYAYFAACQSRQHQSFAGIQVQWPSQIQAGPVRSKYE